MKKLLIIFVFAIATSLVEAKELVKNTDTGMTLNENAGIYSVTGPGGVLVLGGIEKTRDFMVKADACFVQSAINTVIDCNEEQYEVHKDKNGLYIIKIGLGAVKIRPGDATKFLVYLQAKITKDKAKKIWNVITE